MTIGELMDQLKEIAGDYGDEMDVTDEFNIGIIDVVIVNGKCQLWFNEN